MSTGGRTVLGPISKRGNRYLRMLFVQAASFQRTRELMTRRALRGMAANEIGCARISMMVRSISSNTRPDTLVRDHRLQSYDFPLQRAAGPYIRVKTKCVAATGCYPITSSARASSVDGPSVCAALRLIISSKVAGLFLRPSHFPGFWVD